MSDQIQISPAELIAQAGEMKGLCEQFGSAFSSINSALNIINGSWSAKLANNFLSKITSAQNACSGIIGLLDNGAAAANAAAAAFESVDSALAYLMGDGTCSNLSQAAQNIAATMGISPSFLSGLSGDMIQNLMSYIQSGNFSGIADILGTGFTGDMKNKLADIIRDKTGINMDPASVIEHFRKGEYSEALFDMAGASVNIINSAGGLNPVGAATQFLLNVSKDVTNTNGFANKDSQIYADRMLDAWDDGDILGVISSGIDYVIDVPVRQLFKSAGDTVSNIVDLTTKQTLGISVSEINDKLEGLTGINPGKIVQKAGSIIGDAYHAAISDGGIGKSVTDCVSTVAKTGGKFISGAINGLKKGLFG